jgi:hypothetical protein
VRVLGARPRAERTEERDMGERLGEVVSAGGVNSWATEPSRSADTEITEFGEILLRRSEGG